LTQGTTSADRACQACGAGEITTDVNQASCTACSEGKFTTAQKQSACEAWTDCTAGKTVLAVGTAATDRTCEDCAVGKTTTAPNEASCSDVQCLNLGDTVGFAVSEGGHTYGSEREVTCLTGFDGFPATIVCTGLTSTGGWAFKENDALAWDWSTCTPFDVATLANPASPLALITAAVVLAWMA
jgi:Ni,Fe-hydrogenase III small subunit